MRSSYSNKKNALLNALIFIAVFFFACGYVWTQEKKTVEKNRENSDVLKLKNDLPLDKPQNLKESTENDRQYPQDLKDTNEVVTNVFEEDPEIVELKVSELRARQNFFSAKEFQKSGIDEIKYYSDELNKIPKPIKRFQKDEKFHWKPAIKESLYFLGIQQGFRMVQKKTRRELTGEFFADWGTSVKNLGGWRDGDSFATNYIAHPMQGAVTGRIFINNSDRSKKLEFGKTKEYWKSRARAMIWSAAWSTQFELGPISEASIGNVGLYDQEGPNRMGWVDIVVTPIAGTGVIVGEDIIDKYILKKWLELGSSRTRIKLFRTFFTPFQSFTNVLRFKAPWKRDNR